MARTTVKYSEIWQIAYPIILGSLAQNILNVTDTAFLGRVGEVALGASAIGGVFYLVVVMLSWGFGIGTQIIMSRRNGEGEFRAIGHTMEHALYFLLPLSVILFFLMRLFSGEILGYIVKSTAVLESTKDFIRYRSFGIFFASISIAFRSFFIGILNTRVITWSTIVLASTNIILDYCMIFGKYGFPQMGIAGAALASVIAESTAVIFLLVYTLVKIPREKYMLFHFTGFDRRLFSRMFRLSFPVMGQNFLSLAAWLTFFLFVEKLGERALAVSNIIRSFYVVLMIPMWGFSSATSALVSNLIGQGRRDEVIPLAMKILRLCFFMVLVITLAGFIFPRQALVIYTDDPLLISASLDVLYVVNFAAMMLAVAFILFNAVSGTGKTQVTFFIETITIVIYLIATYMLADLLRAPVAVVWTVEFLYGMLMALLSWLYLRKGGWRDTRV
jgi:putative MATE family efflux protein